MVRTVPVLGPAGFSRDLTIKVDHALSNYYITQPSQTDIYRGSVTSLGDTIRKFGNNALILEREVKNSLGGYLQRQFDDADIDVKAIEHEDSIELQITVILRDGDKSIDIQHVVKASNSKIRSIIDLQNNGQPVVQADLLST